MESMCLPLNNQIFRSDAARTFTDAIVGTHRDYEDWICDNYIGLRAALDVFYQDKVINIRTISPDPYGIPFLRCSRIARQILIGMGAENWVDMFRNALNNGFYIMLNCNEYYIPRRSATNTYKYIHSELLHGFNDRTQTFTIYGFTIDRKYESVEVSYTDFIQGVETANYEDTISFGSDANNLIFIQVDHNASYQCSANKMVRCITQYVQSKNLLSELHLYYGTPEDTYNASLLEKYYKIYSKQNIVYGLLCYDIATEWFTKIYTGEISYVFPVNSIYAFIEHKYCMLMRLNWFLENTQRDCTEIIQRYKTDVCDAFVIIMNLLLKYDITYELDCLSKISDRITLIKNREKDILEQFLDVAKS